MHRRRFIETLGKHAARYPEDAGRVARTRALVERHPDCFERTCLPGHVTASAWILSPDHRHFLLGHHRKLDLWLQLGGHADGDPDPARVALREAREESGLDELAFLTDGSEPLPLDHDIHAIPALADEPAHEHHDVRFLLFAGPHPRLRVSEESHALRWFPMAELESVVEDASLRRLGLRVRTLLEKRSVATNGAVMGEER